MTLGWPRSPADMFILPLIILPFILAMAVRRLCQIPAGLWSGRLQVRAHRHALLSAAVAAAYLVLLGYTLALGAALLHAGLLAADRLPAYLSLAGYVLAYPLVYMAAAWVFYHGLQPGARHVAEG